MKLISPKIVAVILLAIIYSACGAEESSEVSSSEVESAQRDSIEELRAERDDLAKQNAVLVAKEEEREAAARAQAEMERRTFPVDAPAGIWTVRMKCVESTCQNRSTGDVITETWNLTYTGGQYLIEVIDAARGTNSEYHGRFDGKSLQAEYSWKGNGFDSFGGSRVIINLRMESEEAMSGTREVLNSNPCSIEYEVSATKR